VVSIVPSFLQRQFCCDAGLLRFNQLFWDSNGPVDYFS
jgi:hypothetical protein